MNTKFLIAPTIASLLCGFPDLVVGEEHAHSHHDEDEHGHADSVKLSPEAMKLYGIDIAEVCARALVEPIVAPGWIVFDPDARALVGSIATGRITAVSARLGDRVEAGQELAEVASTEFGAAQNDYLLKRATIATSMTALEIAEQAHQRALGLKENGGLSMAEIQRREGDLKTARAQLVAAEGEITAAKNTLALFGMDEAAIARLGETGAVSSRLSIRAPIAGAVIEREVSLGSMVSPDDKALFVIADPARLFAICNVHEATVGSVALGHQAVLADLSGKELGSGTVSFVSPEIDAHTRCGPVRIALREAVSALKAGMYVQVRLMPTKADDDQRVLAIPEAAVVVFEDKNTVFVYDGDEFTAREVTTGPAVGGYAPVLSGLRSGERIAVAGAFMLKADLGKDGAEHEH